MPNPTTSEDQARAAGLTLPTPSDLISSGDDAIRRNARFTVDAINAANLAPSIAQAKADAARDQAVKLADTNVTTRATEAATAARDEAVRRAEVVSDARAAAAEIVAKLYTDEAVQDVQAGVVTPSSIDAAVGRALEDGRIDTTVGAAAVTAFYGKEKHLPTLGADDAGAAESDAAMLAALQEAFTAKLPPTPGVASDAQGQTTIYLPAGVYRMTQLHAMLGREAPSAKVAGLRIKGDGRSLTRVLFDPSVDGPLMFNDYWQNIAVEGISFTTLRPGATFMQSYTTHSAQQYTFTDVGWGGPWKYVFDLQGNDNNSEYSFYACSVGGVQKDGAFLYIGPTNTSDQFLNYWFFGFKFWSTSAALIRAHRGGHFHGFGIDCSDWGGEATLTAPSYLFELRGNSHAQGVETFNMHGVRVEAKSNDARLLYSNWAAGNVSLQCDWSSQSAFYTYGDTIVLDFVNVAGPVYNFHDSRLAGTMRVRYGSEGWRHPHRVTVQESTWLQKASPSDVVVYERFATGGNDIDPQVEFVRCRGSVSTSSGSKPGPAVWDATIGHMFGDTIKPMQQRSVALHTPNGNVIAGTNGVFATLPVGALITGLSAVAAPGATAETNGGSWVLKTTEPAPQEIVRATVPAPRSAGHNVRTNLAIPFRCTTQEQASVNLTAEGLWQSNRNVLVMVHGYW